jgi:hypothetical protein
MPLTRLFWTQWHGKTNINYLNAGKNHNITTDNRSFGKLVRIQIFGRDNK